MFAGPLGRSTFTPPKSSFDSPLYGLVSLRRSHIVVGEVRGGEAADLLQALKTVRLQKDRTGDTVDRYGRWLRYVLLDGDNFNARLIRDGYAHAYRRFPFSKRTEFIRLEEQARRRGIGLWNRR